MVVVLLHGLLLPLKRKPVLHLKSVYIIGVGLMIKLVLVFIKGELNHACRFISWDKALGTLLLLHLLGHGKRMHHVLRVESTVVQLVEVLVGEHVRDGLGPVLNYAFDLVVVIIIAERVKTILNIYANFPDVLLLADLLQDCSCNLRSVLVVHLSVV
jgi:hypothetical protein